MINIIRAMRLHQWMKNLLLFVPAMLNVTILAPAEWLSLVASFFCFGLIVSATYIVNDIMDLKADRLHPVKKKRPLASGAITIQQAGLTAALLLFLGLGGAFLWLPNPALFWIISYLAVSILYSWRIKMIAVLDVMFVAGLFTLRLFLGATTLSLPLTPWLPAFAFLFFLSLAFMKRYAELMHWIDQRRGYQAADKIFLLVVGIASGLTSLIVFALFVSIAAGDRENLRYPLYLWVILGILAYWILRLWLKSVRGEMKDDPLAYARGDKVSLVLGALTLALTLLAQLSLG